MARWFSLIDADTGLPVIMNVETGQLFEPGVLDDGKECIACNGRRFQGSTQALALLLAAEVFGS